MTAFLILFIVLMVVSVLFRQIWLLALSVILFLVTCIAGVVDHIIKSKKK